MQSTGQQRLTAKDPPEAAVSAVTQVLQVVSHAVSRVSREHLVDSATAGCGFQRPASYSRDPEYTPKYIYICSIVFKYFGDSLLNHLL